MVSQQCQRLSTGLKPGVNETTFEAKPCNLCVLCLSVVVSAQITTETERTQRWHREEVDSGIGYAAQIE
jgi:hypothetical protein